MELDAQTLQALQKPQGHKYDHGHVLVLSGGPGRTGAARLAARGALRVGAGAVTLGVPPAAQLEVAAQVTSIMLRRIGTAPDLDKVLEDRRINALCLGPALGLDAGASSLIEAALHAQRPCVLDADALTLLARHPMLMALVHHDCILTPHAGEFARLFPDLEQPSENMPQEVKERLACTAARRIGAVVLLKGAVTVIATPDGAHRTHNALGENAVPWLSTAGAGDVLAGFIAGLRARHMPALTAAAAATVLHAACARAFGPGLIAEDLPDVLPRVFRQMGL